MTGTTLSHYRVLERLGEGATAVVYKAEDLALGRPVALKLLPMGLSVDLGKLARFQHEARTTSSLNHPNICTIYEVGEHEGRHFIVMEFLEGKPLSRIIDNRPLEGYRLIELAIQIADGLEAAHEARVIHRDLKPANIYVTERDHVKLLDFGLSMLMPPTSSRSSSSSSAYLSAPGGTGPYMSPEQTLGEPLDTRSDLFSLGVVLYEMATGSRPFMGATHAALVDAIRHERAFPARDMNTDVRDELDRIINKALEKNRKLRYQTASDVAADLRRLKRDLDASPQLAARHTATAVPAPESTTTSSQTRHTAISVVRRALQDLGRQRWALAQLLGAAMIGGIIVAFGLPSDRNRDPHTTSAVAPLVPQPVVTQPVVSVPAPAPTPPSATPVEASVPPRTVARSHATPAAPATATASAPASNTDAATASKASSDISKALKSAQAMADLHLYDQALETLQTAVRGNTTSPSAPTAYLLMASIQERRGKLEDAIALYLDTSVRYPTDSHAPQALFEMAGAILKSRHEARDQQAAKTYTDIATHYTSSSWAARALMARAEIEQRRHQMQVDPMLGRPAPTALSTYREIVQMHPGSPDCEHALWHIANIYEDLKRYDLAADALRDLGTRYTTTAYDAWFVAAEIYLKRLNDPTSARAAYAQVPPTSPHWSDAQKRLSSD
jgi:serine/threonine protein kinase/TolA-binding protein